MVTFRKAGIFIYAISNGGVCLGRIKKMDEEFMFDQNIVSLRSSDMREIANKLDEFNGVKLIDSGA